MRKIPSSRAKRHRRFTYMSIIYLISCLMLASCGEAGSGFAARMTSPSATASPTATASPEPTGQTPPDVTTSWPERALPKLTAALAHDGLPGDLIQQPGTPDLYGIAVPNPPFESPTPAPLPRSGRLIRIDLTNQLVTPGPTVSSDAQLLTIGASVYLFSPRGMTGNGVAVGPYSLRAIEDISLGAPVSLLSLIGSGRIVYATSNPQLPDHGLWLATASPNGPSHLWLVDSQTGRILQQKAFAGEIRSIAPSLDGKRLYLARFTQPWYQTTPGATPNAVTKNTVPASFQVIPVGGGYFPPYFFIDELDAGSGRTIVSSGQEILAVGAGLVAINGGVWVSAAAGMNSREMYLLRQSDLKQIAEPRYVPKSLDRDNEAVPIEATQTGSIFWLESWAGLSCIDPTSGVERAGLAFPNHDGQTSGRLTPVAGWDQWIYALVDLRQAGPATLVAFKPPSACG